jgi:bacterioferritin-associated ferredoxin
LPTLFGIMLACICFAVTDEELDETISTGARTAEEVGVACGAGTGCGSCLDRICARLIITDQDHGRMPMRTAS